MAFPAVHRHAIASASGAILRGGLISYASVEQRDNPTLQGCPVAVGNAAKRGVVVAASLRGARSAMPSSTALRKCPDLDFQREQRAESPPLDAEGPYVDWPDLTDPFFNSQLFSQAANEPRKLVSIKPSRIQFMASSSRLVWSSLRNATVPGCAGRRSSLSVDGAAPQFE
jgi:nucleotidyltransferase/DNA polymerase involved in DNA repair